MALQLGALRDALLAANVSSETASAAAEEVAGYENRLTRLTTMTQVSIGILVLLLGSQAALWMEIGHLNSELSRLNDALLHLTAQVDQISRAVVH